MTHCIVLFLVRFQFASRAKTIKNCPEVNEVRIMSFARLQTFPIQAMRLVLVNDHIHIFILLYFTTKWSSREFSGNHQEVNST